MNQDLGQKPTPSPPAFTEKQGQQLAFIYAYTLVLGRPLPKPTSSATSWYRRRRPTTSCSPWSAWD